jgi:hypothetical protein
VAELPPDWRTMTLRQLQDLLRQVLRTGDVESPYYWPHMTYRKRHELIAWVETHVELGLCPACKRRI